MFPSTHDVTILNLTECIWVLSKLLYAGNKVLLVSKPNLDCIMAICDSFHRYRKQLSFRFTIGSMDPRVLAFWEPNAPVFMERKQCLKCAYSERYQTSVSCEPFLDCDVNQIFGLYEELKPYITDSFWIGKLRNLNKRVDMSGVTYEQKENFVKPLKAAQSDEFVLGICIRLDGERFIKWKDSIREVIDK